MATRTDSTPAGGEKNRPESAVPLGATNAMEVARGRKGSSRTERGTDAAVELVSAQRKPENSIQPAKRRAKSSDSSSRPKPRRDALRNADDRAAAPEHGRRQDRQDSSSARTSPERQRLVPDHVRQRFVQVGKHYYFADGARAFTDRGGRLTTPSENTEVIRSLVVIAEARGWNEITVRGTERFRKEAWFAARLAGLEVRGYRPTEFEQAHLVRTLSRDGRGAAQEAAGGALSGLERREQPEDGRGDGSRNGGDPGRQGRQRGLLTGKLVDHGPATYRHDPREPMSYFVKIETSRGDRTIWGVDLERAMKESLSRPQIGDEVGLRAVRQEAVKVRAHERDTEGKVVAEKDLNTHRNRWIVEKRAFFEARAEAARTLRDVAVEPKQAVKRHPELVGTYLQVHAAELASKQFRDREDQERFVTQVRSALADAVARGEPLPPVRLRESAPERAAARSIHGRDREPARARE
jgi:conjugative element/phage-associated large polyvalent protein